MKTIEERFWIKVDRSGGPSACWPWTAHIGKNGYGRLSNRDGFTHIAHRIAYQLTIGPIPEGLTIDHLCHNKACQNPTHMEPVTLTENIQRRYRIRTHCKNGHEFTDENTIRNKNGRTCRTCARRAAREWKRRNARSASL